MNNSLGGNKRMNDVPSLFPAQRVTKQASRKEIKHTVVTPRKWPKVITKVKHDHTYAAWHSEGHESATAATSSSVSSQSCLTITNNDMATKLIVPLY